MHDRTEGARRRPKARRPEKLLAVARAAAAEAGKLLVDGRPEQLGVAQTKSSPTDVVTEMDTAARTTIRAAILRVRPEDGFLGEEGGSAPGASGVRWVVDPIDGTVNYLYGLPAWAVSIGAEVDGVGVAGVVLAPQLGEEYTAVLGAAPGSGARLAVRASPRTWTGPGRHGLRIPRRTARVQGRIVAGLISRVRDIRRGGSAALDLCAVAAGRVDGYFERGTHPGTGPRAPWSRRGGSPSWRVSTELPPRSRWCWPPDPALFPDLHDASWSVWAPTSRDY
jgi:myo-inositol-1(or 4)-monophosphatase